MAPFGKIYTYIPNARVLKAQAAAAVNGLEVELPSDFQFGIANRTPEFKSKFPPGKVPALECQDGVTIFESDAIAQYIADSGPKAAQLLGSNPLERAVIRQWICFADGEVMTHVSNLVTWRVGMVPYNAEVEEKSMASLKNALQVFEGHLQKRTTWVATEELSLADLSLACALYWGFMLLIDSEMRDEFPQVTQWYKRVISQDSVKEVFKDATFVDKRRNYVE